MEVKFKNNLNFYDAKRRVILEKPDLVKNLPGEKVERGRTWTNVVASAAPAPTQAPTVSAGIADKLMEQQQKFLVKLQELMAKQNENIVKMQEQINTLFTLVQKQYLNVPNTHNVMPSTSIMPEIPIVQSNKTRLNCLKRSHSAGSVSSDETQPAKITPSVRPEDNQSEVTEVMESPQMDNATTEGAVGGRGRSNRPSTHSTDSSAPSSGRNVKGGGKTGSSQSTDGKGAVSKKAKPKPITAPINHLDN